jgi:hypothetical protein
MGKGAADNANEVKELQRRQGRGLGLRSRFAPTHVSGYGEYEVVVTQIQQSQRKLLAPQTRSATLSPMRSWEIQRNYLDFSWFRTKVEKYAQDAEYE